MIKEAKKGIDRTIAPKIVDAVDFDLRLKPYQKYTLKNGVEVYAIDAGAEEVMMVEWVYYAGIGMKKKSCSSCNKFHVEKWDVFKDSIPGQ